MERPRVMAVGAHPDDLELLCGGTLARYADLGHEVVMVHLLNGDKGHYEMTSNELVRVRQQEARAAGAVIGAEVLCPGIPDGELFSDLPTRRLMIDLIRQARPGLIITHAPNDYMSDHVATSQLVCDASFLAAAPLLKTEHQYSDRIAPVFFMDTVAGDGFLPTEYVDISEHIDIKRKMLTCHESQVTFLKEHDRIDVLELMEVTNRFRGFQCGVRYAEAFRTHEAWGRRATRRLLP